MEVTKKNPKKVEVGKKAYQARLLKLNEKILASTTGTTASNHWYQLVVVTLVALVVTLVALVVTLVLLPPLVAKGLLMSTCMV